MKKFRQLMVYAGFPVLLAVSSPRWADAAEFEGFYICDSEIFPSFFQISKEESGNHAGFFLQAMPLTQIPEKELKGGLLMEIEAPPGMPQTSGLSSSFALYHKNGGYYFNLGLENDWFPEIPCKKTNAQVYSASIVYLIPKFLKFRALAQIDACTSKLQLLRNINTAYHQDHKKYGFSVKMLEAENFGHNLMEQMTAQCADFRYSLEKNGTGYKASARPKGRFQNQCLLTVTHKKDVYRTGDCEHLKSDPPNGF